MCLSFFVTEVWRRLEGGLGVKVGFNRWTVPLFREDRFGLFDLAEKIGHNY